MTGMQAPYEPIVVNFEWDDPLMGRVVLGCRFTLGGVRHVVEGHFRRCGEAWGRLLPRSLVDRLAAATELGQDWVLSGEDFRVIVEGIAAAVHVSCRRPLLCVVGETPLAVGDGGHQRPIRNAQTVAKAMFVLQSGATVFAATDRLPAANGARISGRFLSCYFSARNGWESPRRAYATAARGYVQRWAPHLHRSGARKLPSPLERAITSHDGKKVERSRFRFVTPATWGFRPADDGEIVFHEVPGWTS